MSEHIIVEQYKDAPGVVKIRINRPDRKNALNLAMYGTLAKAIDDASSNSDTRVIVITGSDGCFTSGNDLQDFSKGLTGLTAEDSELKKFLLTLSQCPLPVIAAVQGVAVGIGTTLLLHCDLIYAEDNAKFRLPFANMGLCPEFASSLLLTRVAGYAKASEWLLLGDFFSAQDALKAGLVNEVTDNAIELAMTKAKALSQQPPQAIKHTKALLKAPLQERIQKTIYNEAVLFEKLLKGKEFFSAVSTFFSKKKT